LYKIHVDEPPNNTTAWKILKKYVNNGTSLNINAKRSRGKHAGLSEENINAVREALKKLGLDLMILLYFYAFQPPMFSSINECVLFTEVPFFIKVLLFFEEGNCINGDFYEREIR